MPLFHPKVIKRHALSIAVDPQHIAVLKQWADNLEKGVFDIETQGDGRFIERILGNVLGYVARGDAPQWTASKNQDIGGGNVDVALGNFTADTIQILAPLELKGAKTNLDINTSRNETPVQQAWRYANAVEGTKWVLVSNYREIRLYAYGKGNKNYETFDLTTLPTEPEQYKRLILLLSAQNLLGIKTQSLLDESEQTGKDITDKFYKEYKAFRVRLIDHLTKDNPAIGKLDIIHHAQKILDRILFVAFAESRELLPPNTLENTYVADNPYNPQPTWKNFVGLFGAINEGNAALGITSYNGGLFADDPDLNELKVSDYLCKGFKDIGSYDFNTEISVDILGHIFEQSISDLEELRAVAENGGTAAGSFDKKKSKRKKDGVFYTPPYITQYIVEQTVGNWLVERRREIGFDSLPELSEIDYARLAQSKGKQSIADKHIAAWEAYKEAMSHIKVLDPACGSGAFLIEVFDYLCREGKRINDELSRLRGGQRSIFRWDTYILANNLFGVDLNRESVEITKLSLWLKTANKGEKLTYLENNIKVGNSLIDDKSVVGDLAFDWHKEFPQVFASKEPGRSAVPGFDIVVGNPPYVRPHKIDDIEKVFLWKTYKVASQKTDLYAFFTEKGLSLLRKNGSLGFIMPKTWFSLHSFFQLRQLVLNSYYLYKIGLLPQKVFQDATVETSTVIVKNTQAEDHCNITFYDVIKKEELQTMKVGVIRHDDSLNINARPKQQFNNVIELGEISIIIVGIVTGNDKKFCRFEKITELDKPAIRGANISRYSLNYSGEYIWYDREKMIEESNSKPKTTLKGGGLLCSPKNPSDFEVPEKIVLQRISKRIIATLDTNQCYTHSTAVIIRSKNPAMFCNKFLLTILNSSFVNDWLITNRSNVSVNVGTIQKIPIPNISPAAQQPFIVLAEKMLSLHEELQKERVRFQTLLSDNLGAVKMDVKRFDGLSEFKDFLDELKRQKCPIPLSEQSEWRVMFEKAKQTIESLVDVIGKTDAAIDRMVYDLHDLTPEEVAIVEGR